jgi:hypothetical protein
MWLSSFSVVRRVVENAIATEYLARASDPRNKNYYERLMMGKVELRGEDRIAICSAEPCEVRSNPAARYYLLDGVGRALPYMILLKEGNLQRMPIARHSGSRDHKVNGFKPAQRKNCVRYDAPGRAISTQALPLLFPFSQLVDEFPVSTNLPAISSEQMLPPILAGSFTPRHETPRPAVLYSHRRNLRILGNPVDKRRRSTSERASHDVPI